MAKSDEIKAELQKRHDAGKATGEDRLNLDALELIERLQKRLLEVEQKTVKADIRRLKNRLQYQRGVFTVGAIGYFNGTTDAIATLKRYLKKIERTK